MPPQAPPGELTPPLKPLLGQVVLNTREAGEAQVLSQKLRALGASVLEQPTLVFAPPIDWTPFDQAFSTLKPGDWVGFSSANAIRFTVERLKATGGIGKLREVKLAAVGKATAQVLAEFELTPELVPAHFQSDDLLALMVERLPLHSRVWLPRAQEGRTVIEEGLLKAGHTVMATPAYRTIAPPEGVRGQTLSALVAHALDWVIFTSPSTVHNLLEMVPANFQRPLRSGHTQVACLGAVTAQAARDAGLLPVVVPTTQTLDGLLEALVAYVKAHPKPIE